MSSILDLVNSDLGKQIIEGVSQKTGTSTNDTSAVLTSALPALIGGMKNNASTSGGAESLLSALTGGKHDGGILDNLSGFLGGSNFSDGAGILGHVFGNKQSAVETAVSEKTGVSAGQVGQILKIAAPLVMAYLAKQTQQSNVSNGGGLMDMLGGLMGSQSSGGNSSILTSLIDKNGDGDIKDDLMKMGSSLLGNLFKK